ncbi:MAG: DUF6117 family protein [Dehalococcoidia bacterium]|nr:DUF6117 family protein [Dehalococcoidia bacterium]
MLQEGDKQNYETLLEAAKNGALALVECTDKLTGEYVAVVAAVNRPMGDYELVPLARLFPGNPYDLVDPPGFQESENSVFPTEE